MSKHPDLIKWEKEYGYSLFIGSRVTIRPSAMRYEAQYDKGKAYMVTEMYVDSGGLNIGLDDGENINGDVRYICESDGYYIADLEPSPAC